MGISGAAARAGSRGGAGPRGAGPAPDGWVSAMKPVRCAVVGLGMIGQEHAAVLASSPLAELLACCDLDSGAAARAPAGVPVTADLGELLDLPELEAVFICTPQET